MPLLLDNVAPDHHDGIALTDPRMAMTWREVAASVDRATNGMLAQVPPGHRLGGRRGRDLHVVVARELRDRPGDHGRRRAVDRLLTCAEKTKGGLPAAPPFSVSNPDRPHVTIVLG